MQASGQKSRSNLEASQKLLRGSRRLTVGSCPAVTGRKSRRQRDSTCTSCRYLPAPLPDAGVPAVPSIPPTDALLLLLVVVAVAVAAVVVAVVLARRRGVSAK